MSDTQIHDLGYRAYSGERAGVPGAVRSLVVHTMRRSLGLKRPARHKIAPAIAIVIAYAPALAMTGFAAFLRADFVRDLLGYGEYFGINHLIEKLLGSKESIGRYLMNEYWLDIGQIEDYTEAEDAYRQHFSENDD